MKPRTGSVAILGAAGVLLLTAACATSNAASNDTGNGATTTSTEFPSVDAGTTVNSGSAPRVENPLKAAAFTDTTCAALNADDLAALDLTSAQATASTVAGSPSCEWQVLSSGLTDSVAWLTPNENGLNSLYERRADLEYFDLTNVDGYPAVFASEADLRTSGTCVLNVGVNDHLYFFVDYEAATNGIPSEAYKQQSCAAAKQTAAAVIRNLQSRQGA